MKSKTNMCIGVVLAALFCAGSSMGQVTPIARSTRTEASANTAHLSRDGFGRPETIAGTVLMVEPEADVLVISVPNSQPNTTRLIGTEHVVQAGDLVVRQDKVSAVKEPGETDYAFRLTGDTLVQKNGQRLLLADLAMSRGQQATVRFIPQRSGNYVLGIELDE
ncbi:MAG TPA: hypothetical protein VGW33_01040 [Terriglobia bacterium]|nr:hypothetical protein [Terriglobia bacterium]